MVYKLDVDLWAVEIFVNVVNVSWKIGVICYLRRTPVDASDFGLQLKEYLIYSLVVLQGNL
jgi:hypothetical protein